MTATHTVYDADIALIDQAIADIKARVTARAYADDDLLGMTAAQALEGDLSRLVALGMRRERIIIDGQQSNA